jgi:hypothetical protein
MENFSMEIFNFFFTNVRDAIAILDLPSLRVSYANEVLYNKFFSSDVTNANTVSIMDLFDEDKGSLVKSRLETLEENQQSRFTITTKREGCSNLRLEILAKRLNSQVLLLINERDASTGILERKKEKRINRYLGLNKFTITNVLWEH